MSFELLQPDSLSGALDALAQHGDEAKVMAGGTAVVLMLQQKLIAPTVLVSIGRLPDLAYIRADPDGMHIGPLTTLRDMERSSDIQRRFPLLARACGEVGNVRIRNQATLGGNLAEADYASDPPTALLALGAQVTATGIRGARTIPLEDFLVGFYTTNLVPDELITDIFIPACTPGSRIATREGHTVDGGAERQPGAQRLFVGCEVAATQPVPEARGLRRSPLAHARRIQRAADVGLAVLRFRVRSGEGGQSHAEGGRSQREERPGSVRHPCAQRLPPSSDSRISAITTACASPSAGRSASTAGSESTTASICANTSGSTPRKRRPRPAPSSSRSTLACTTKGSLAEAS